MNSKKLDEIRDKCYKEPGYLTRLACEIGLSPGNTMQLVDRLYTWIHSPQYRIEREGYTFWTEERHKEVDDSNTRQDDM